METWTHLQYFESVKKGDGRCLDLSPESYVRSYERVDLEEKKSKTK